MNQYRQETSYVRKPYEVYSTYLWLSVFVFYALSSILFFGFIAMPYALIASGMCVYFYRRDPEIYTGQSAKTWIMNLNDFDKFDAKIKRPKDRVWIGEGFPWSDQEAQRVMDIRRSGAYEGTDDASGLTWLHELKKSNDVMITKKALNGGLGVFGVTGSGKTRFLSVLLTQIVKDGDVAFVIDPKGDTELLELVRDSSRRYNREYMIFKPSRPMESFRFDPLRNWSNSTEVASRIVDMLSSESGGYDVFSAFSWNAINNIVGGLIEIGVRPNLLNIKEFIEGDPSSLTERALEAYFERHAPDWRDHILEMEELEKNMSKEAIKASKSLMALPPRVRMYIQYFRNVVSKDHPSSSISGLISMTEHDREHFSKMITSVIPVLGMLTSGYLGELLCPNPDNLDDPRPIMDTAKLIESNQVVYIGLDSLADKTIASALGSIIMADLAAVAGDRYSRNVQDGKRIFILIDEAAEVVNDPTIRILNKGRGANFHCVMFMQTINDLTARMGSDAKARMLLGNCNSIVCQRVRDEMTQKYVAESMGKARVKESRQSMGTSLSSEKHLESYSGSKSVSIVETEVDLFPHELLGAIPNFEYIGILSGGRLVKGRFPVMITEEG